MTRVIVDADLRAKLHNLETPLELCDESGKILARVNPAIDWSQYELLTEEISEEEIKRRLASDRRYSTQEVLEILKRH
jgi:hypothetical protein